MKPEQQHSREDSTISDQPLTDYLELKFGKRMAKTIDRLTIVLSTVAALSAGQIANRNHFDSPKPHEVAEPYGIDEKTVQYLTDMYGPDAVHEFVYWNQEQSKKSASSQSSEGAQSELVDFRTIDADSTRMAEIFVASYPKNWVKNDVGSIQFLPGKADSMPDQYGISGLSSGVTQRNSVQAGDSVIRLYQENIYDIVNTYSHETGHANDWFSDSQHSIQQRADLFRRVSERFFSGDSLFPSDYVTEISNPDSLESRKLKVTEYWAEICGAYFNDSNYLRQTYPNDFSLVDSWVHDGDPSFNPRDAERQRDAAIVERDISLRFGDRPEIIERIHEHVEFVIADLKAWKKRMEDQMARGDMSGGSWSSRELVQQLDGPLSEFNLSKKDGEAARSFCESLYAIKTNN